MVDSIKSKSLLCFQLLLFAGSLLVVFPVDCSIGDALAPALAGVNQQISLPVVANHLSEFNSNDIKFPPQPDLSSESPRDDLKSGIFQKIGNFVKKAIAPAQSYVSIVNRYHKWFHNYKAFQKLSKKKLADANDVLKLEYALLEADMIAEEEAKREEEAKKEEEAKREAGETQEVASDADKENEVNEIKPVDAENMDFVFKVLKRLIDRLEARLERLKKQEGVEVDLNDTSPIDEMDPEAVKRAMERVKKAMIKSAKEIMVGEAAIIARTTALNGLAHFMAAKPDTGDALDHLRPIIFMIGSATTPVAVSYLMGLEFRGALAIFDHVNPMTEMFNKWKEDRHKRLLQAA